LRAHAYRLTAAAAADTRLTLVRNCAASCTSTLACLRIRAPSALRCALLTRRDCYLIRRYITPHAQRLPGAAAPTWRDAATANSLPPPHCTINGRSAA